MLCSLKVLSAVTQTQTDLAHPGTWRQLLLSDVLPGVDASGGRSLPGRASLDFACPRRREALYYYNARYYDPDLGRFIQADSVLDGLNRYSYCHNNPINGTDPTGEIEKVEKTDTETAYVVTATHRTVAYVQQAPSPPQTPKHKPAAAPAPAEPDPANTGDNPATDVPKVLPRIQRTTVATWDVQDRYNYMASTLTTTMRDVDGSLPRLLCFAESDTVTTVGWIDAGGKRQVRSPVHDGPDITATIRLEADFQSRSGMITTMVVNRDMDSGGPVAAFSYEKVQGERLVGHGQQS